MREIKINKNSLLHRAMVTTANISNIDIEDGYIDSCAYNAAIIRTIMMITVLGILGLLFLVCEADALAYIVAGFNYDFTTPIPLSIIANMVIIFPALFLFIIVFIRMMIATNKYESIKKLIRAYKENYCAKISFTKED